MEKVTTIFLDVDGTMTDGNIYLDNQKNELKSFNVKDGLLIAALIRAGYQVLIMTGRESQVVARRAAELGITDCYQGIKDKRSLLEKLMKKNNFTYQNLAYLGDDLNDLSVMKQVAFAGCPADAVPEIKAVADYISEFRGGRGAVRDILSYLLKEQGEYEQIINQYS